MKSPKHLNPCKVCGSFPQVYPFSHNPKYVAVGCPNRCRGDVLKKDLAEAKSEWNSLNL